jgi:hypothetical protein
MGSKLHSIVQLYVRSHFPIISQFPISQVCYMEIHFTRYISKSLFTFEISFSVDISSLLYIFMQHLKTSRHGNIPFDPLHEAGPEDIQYFLWLTSV